MNTPATLGSSLLKSLLSLREEKGDLRIEDVGAMFMSMAQSLQPTGEAEQFLRVEIQKLAAFIEKAKAEINSMAENAEGGKVSGDATLQLDAVIKATEEASNTIMDAADAIQAAASGVGGDKEQALMDASMRIYEACNFQDLTGQRLTKVITLLNEIDTRVHNILSMFGKVEVKDAPAGGDNVIPANFTEKDLMNGPQLKAPTQADIDAMFANFKG